MTTQSASKKRQELLAEIEKSTRKASMYHMLDLPDFGHRGKRKRPGARLDIILDHFVPDGKTILDLGCSNGFYCYQLAQRGGLVTGIDKNNEILDLNRKISAFYEWDIHFEEHFMDLEFFQSIEHYDAVLFLAVLHHIFNHTFVHPIEYCREIIEALSKKTNLLFFEIGQSGEPFAWSRKLALMEPDPKQWVLDNLFAGSEFDQIEVIEPPAFSNGLLGNIREGIWGLHRRWTVLPPRHFFRKLLMRLLVKFFIYDPRDTRYIFIARKNR